VIFAGMEPIPGIHLTQQLGKGAFGEVWEGLTADGSPVALKFIDCRAKSPSLISSEIRVLRGLNSFHHPNIIKFHEVHATSRYIVLRMERAAGNLADLQRAYQHETGTVLPAKHLVSLLGQAAAGLDFLAGARLPGFNLVSRGLQHCDVKPSNLLILGDMVKVADFGLCAATAWQTHWNSWKGTLPYAAPELFKGQASDRTDQYALAVTYCELVTGGRAILSTKTLEAGLAVVPVDFMKMPDPQVPVIRRALHPIPSLRWPSCQDFIAALRQVVQGPGHTSRSFSGQFRRSLRRVGAVRGPRWLTPQGRAPRDP
jgi:serine/threonine protein kinase